MTKPSKNILLAMTIFSGLACADIGLEVAHAQRMPSIGNVGSQGGAQQRQSSTTYAILPSEPPIQNPFPSSDHGDPLKPPSSDRVTLSGATVQSQVDHVLSGVQERMKGIHPGSGSLDPDQTPDTTLQAILSHEEKMRQINMLKTEVDASMGLWGATYAGPREDIKTGAAINPSMGVLNAQRPVRVDPAIAAKKAEEDAKVQRENAARQAEDDAREKNQEIAADIAGRKHALGQIPPVVSSIYGSVRNPKAFILVPYLGSVEITHVGQTFSLIDNSTMKVTSLSVDGVYASHDGGPSRKIGNGTSVPTAADAVSMFNAISNPDVVAQAQQQTQAGMNSSMSPAMPGGMPMGMGMPMSGPAAGMNMSGVR